jgi:hypothetical protein
VTLATSVDALVERVRRDSLLASRGPVHTLGAAYTAGGTMLTLNETPTHIGAGEIISIDYELFYVQEVVSATKMVTVIPGYLGSTQADHAEDAVLEVAPRFPKAALLDHVENEIRSWGNELWRTTALNLDVNITDRTYDLLGASGEIYFLLDARQEPSGLSSNFWHFSWTGDAWPHLDARLLRQMDTGEFSTGFAIQFKMPPTHAGGVRVVFAQPFDLSTLAAATDLVSTVGLRADWLDIVEYGTKMRALETSVIGRSDWRTSNMAREPDEVSALDTVRAVGHFRDMRQLRFTKAGVDLRSEFPYRAA